MTIYHTHEDLYLTKKGSISDKSKSELVAHANLLMLANTDKFKVDSLRVLFIIRLMKNFLKFILKREMNKSFI